MKRTTNRDPLAPMLKLLRPYVQPEDRQLDHHKFLAAVTQRIMADRKAYKRLRTGIRQHSKLRRDIPTS